MRICKWLISAFMICVVPVSVNAQLERTVWAWDTRTPEQGNFSAGVWYTHGQYDYQGIDADGRTADLEFLFSYGVTSKWSVGIIAAWNRWEETVFETHFSDAGIGDTQAVTTLRLLDESRTGIDFALRGVLGIPTGDEYKYIGTGHWEPKIEILAAKSLGPVLAVANLGIKRIIDSGDAEKDFIYNGNLECVLPLADRISASAILSGWTPRWKSSMDDTYLQVGAGLRVAPTNRTFISGTVYHLAGSERLDNAWYFSLGLGMEF